MSNSANIEGLKAGVAGKDGNDNPHDKGSYDYESWDEGNTSGINAGEVPLSSDMFRIWNE